VPLVLVEQGPIGGLNRVVRCSCGMVVDMVLEEVVVEVGESYGGQCFVGE
jgi:hypothetical protein